MSELREMYNAQRKLQTEAYGKDPLTLEGEERIQFARDMREALEAELQEAMDEIGWKPWATSNHFNQEAFKGELVDAWHFFMNLMMAADMYPDELIAGYYQKREKNLKRQQEGYDGVAGKCPGCRRALDDNAVLCAWDGNMIWCSHLAQYYHPEA